jgi:spore germination cell wall hydrolase CwlJ-like protein
MIKYLIVICFIFTFTILSEETLPVFQMMQYKCLVDNAYHEARGEGHKGMVAVTKVVMTRASEKNKSYCEIVYAPYQFSWTTDKRNGKRELEKVSRLAAEEAVYASISIPPASAISKISPRYVVGRLEELESPILLANHYHNKNVKPLWARHMKRVGVVGNHIFYRG